MKASLILFLFMLASFSPLWAAQPRSIARKVTADNFQRNTRPLAKTILNQFYDLLEKISPEQSEMIYVKQNLTEIQLLWNSWLKNCAQGNGDCSNRITDIHRRLIKIEKFILALERKNTTLKKGLHGHEVDSRIDLMDTLQEMSNQCFVLLNTVETQLIQSDFIIPAKKFYYTRFSNTLHLMSLDAERSFLNGLSDTLQPHFDSVWNSFFKDLERYVVIDGRVDLFAQRVEEWNLTWNAFFAKMTGENFTIPDGTKFYLQSIHQNWNGILRPL